MTCKPVRALRSIGESSLPIAVILFALLGCSDRSIPPSPSSKPAALSGQSGLAFVQVPAAEIRAAIEVCVINGPDPALGVLTRPEQVELKELYEREDYVPLWVDAAGRLSDSAHDALALLSLAADEGLDPADYLSLIHI